MKSLLDIDPARYQRHALHRGERIWAETNCYTDVVIELLHALGHEPRAALAFTLGVDFEGDQWTFFKFRDADLVLLYALEVEELTPWRGLVGHIEEQIARGCPVLVELDAYFLPDTQGTAYGLAHVKSTVAVNAIDGAARRLGYFHNQGYHELAGDDFDALFQTAGLVHPRMLPPYVEFLKPQRRRAPLRGAALRDASLALLRAEIERLPLRNPFEAFGARFAQDLEWLVTQDIDVFHAYSFVTFRQFGACFELGADYLDWLGAQGVAALAPAAAELRALAAESKICQFQLARSVARRRGLDLAPVAALGLRWERAGAALRGALA
jgi:hypothetical protein